MDQPQISQNDADILTGEGRERYPVSGQLGRSRDKRDPETYLIIGAAMEVHREFGQGFLEAVYQDALECEFKTRNIPFIREHSIPVIYKGTKLGTPYRADFLCFGSVLVELKAIKALSQIEDAQVIHYLKATGVQRAMLINFGTPSLEYKRLVHHLRESATSAVP